MPKKRYRSEEIIHKLREADVLVGQGRTIPEITRQWGVTDATYYRWRKEYGGMKIDQAKRLKDLEQENARLRRALPVRPAFFSPWYRMRTSLCSMHSEVTCRRWHSN
jgi:putative transposase